MKLTCFEENLTLLQSFEELLLSDVDSEITLGNFINLNSRNFIQYVYNADILTKANAGLSRWLLSDTHATQDVRVQSINYGFLFGGNITGFVNKRYHEDGVGVLTSRYSLIKSSYHIQDNRQTLSRSLFFIDESDIYFVANTPTLYYDGTLIFLGVLEKQFGHFVLEGLSRLYILDFISEINSKYRDVKFAILNSDVQSFGYEFLSILGITKEQLYFVPREGVCVRKCIIPDPAVITHRAISSLQSFIYKSYYTTQVSQKIYLSRKFAKKRRLLNEDIVERYFSEIGYKIIYPEKLSVTEQLNLLSSADSIAGPTGSQMYLAAFMKREGSVFVIAPCNFYLKDDLLISAVKNHNISVVLGSPIDFSKPKTEWDWSIDPDALNNAFISNFNQG